MMSELLTASLASSLSLMNNRTSLADSYHVPRRDDLYVHSTLTESANQLTDIPSRICSGLVAFRFLNSRLNPWNPKKQSRRHASANARRAALASQSARLQSAPLSRPDESAIFFNESAISLHEEPEVEAQKVKEEKEERVLDWRTARLFWAPAACDICGTTASELSVLSFRHSLLTLSSPVNVGLLFVPVSIYQMLRGALVLWVGVFSVIFLHRKLTKAQWTALATVMAGIAVVGCSSLLGTEKEAVENAAEKEAAVSPLAGVCLIIVAQVL